MKKLLSFLLVAFASVSLIAMASCGTPSEEGGGEKPPIVNPGTPENPSNPDNPSEPDNPVTPDEPEELLEITGVTFENLTVTYDGTEKSVKTNGTLPEGVTASYTNNVGVQAGTYEATAVLSGEGYQTKTLTATLLIEKATMVGITLDGDKSVEYDTLEHSLQIMGNVPEGTTVVITYNGEEVVGVTEVGTYRVVATVSAPNYHDLILEEMLKITSKEEQLYSVNLNGTVYFQNNLDGNRLYSYSLSGLKKVNNDAPKFMFGDGEKLYYTSGAIIPAIKSYEGGLLASKLYSANASCMTTDGTYLYYSVSGLLASAESRGIWKIKLDGSETAPTRITSDKAKEMVYYDGALYYCNASEKKFLYQISTGATEGKGTLLWDEEVEYLIEDGGALYFNSTKSTLGGIVDTASAIRKYVISSGACIKLTVDSGKYLTKIGSYIYYISNDLLTSSLFGDGIYRVSALGTSDSVFPGERVLKAEGDGFSSLTSDGTRLYYYRLNDKHFYSYQLSTQAETDLMRNFVVVDETTLSGYAKVAEYNGEIYFTNVRDNGYLYKYSPDTKSYFKIVDDQTSGIYFNGKYLYYTTYVLTNYALWRMDLDTNEIQKISSDRYDHLIFDGDVIYCIKVGSAYNNYIYKMNLDGSNPVKLFETTLWVSDFYKEGDYLYCLSNAGFLGKDDYLYAYKISDGTASKYEFEAEAFTVSNGIVYYYDHNENALKSYDGSKTQTIATSVVVNDLAVIDGKLYYSSVSKTVGFFCYNLATGATEQISETNADAIYEYEGCVYFLQVGVTYSNDYPVLNGNEQNNGHLYCYDGTNVIKLT